MIFKFEKSVLNTDNFTLHVNGKHESVEPHVFDLISYLIMNRQRLVSRDELFNELWTGREVCDATLSNNIKCARAVLGDDGERQSIIKTTRGRGYQFIAKVETESEVIVDRRKHETHGQLAKRILSRVYNCKRLLWSLCTVVILVMFGLTDFFWSTGSKKKSNDIGLHGSEHSIAVLPFKRYSNIEEQSIFINGLHSDLLVYITKIPSLKSISRHSVMTYRDSKKNIRVIAQELGVTTILHGSIQSVAGKIRININLIDALADEHIWAETYTRNLTDENILMIQEELAKSIAAAIESSFSEKELLNINRSYSEPVVNH